MVRADAARNRERVLVAAREAFARRGLDVPIDEIARAAGVGAGTVHRHFPTKETLYTAVLAVLVALLLSLTGLPTAEHAPSTAPDAGAPPPTLAPTETGP